MNLKRPHILLVIVSLVFCAAGCSHKSAPVSVVAVDTSQLPSVKSTVVTIASIERSVVATGTFSPLRKGTASVVFGVGGLLNALPVRVGQAVSQGEVVAQLSTLPIIGQIQQATATIEQNKVQVQQAEINALQQNQISSTGVLQAQAALANAVANVRVAQATLSGDQATLDNAEQTLQRERGLLAEGLVAQKDVESADLAVSSARSVVAAQVQTIAAQRETVVSQQHAVEAARAATMQNLIKTKDVQVARQQVHNAEGALSTARAQLALYTLRAPISGIVTEVGANIGETVDTTTKIMTITNLDEVQFEIGLPTSDANLVRPGLHVSLNVEGQPTKAYQTTIKTVGTQVDPATNSIPVLAVMTNTGHIFKDGELARAKITIEKHIAAMVLPRSAVLTDSTTGRKSVVTIDRHNIAHVVPVAVGMSEGDSVELLSGVRPGDTVAVSGQYGLPDGTKVSVNRAP